MASFNVLRGEGQAMLDQIARVTSTALTDAGLNSGTEYCYQIITNDASANASGPSDIACATTTGAVVGGDQSPVTPPVVTPPAGNQGLLAVDVSGLVCETDLGIN